MPEEPDSLEVASLERVGKTVCGKWTLERLLGVGGVAAVYAARHRNGRRVAVKVLHPELSVDSRMRKRFLREGYVANKVEHPGAVAVLDDAVDEDGSVILVMELLDGETFESRCQRLGGQLPPAEALTIAHGLLDVLACAHEHEVLHRDVTPANVFITRQGQVKLLDFGIARMREPSGESITGSVPGTLGTPGFMPPEQARGLWQELDARTDLWAVGAILYRALAGRSVHIGRTPSEILLAAMTKRAASLADTLTEAPDTLVALVDQALAFEPDQRFPSAKAFQQAVGAVYQSIAGKPIEEAVLAPPPAGATPAVDRGSATQAAAFGTTVPIPTAARTSSWTRAAVVGGAIAAVGIAVLFAVSSGEEPSAAPAPTPNPEPAFTQPTPSTTAPEVSVGPAVSAPSPPATETAGPTPSVTVPKSRPLSPARPTKPVARPQSEDDVLDQRK